MVTVKRPKWADVKLPDFGDLVVLDIGCSSTKRGVSSNYYSLDINKNFKPTIIGDALHLPIKDSSVDVILAIGILEHLSEPQIAVDEMHRVLKEGGGLYVSVPFMGFRHDATDYYRFTEEGLLHVLRKFEILIVEREYRGFFSVITSWLIPVTYAFPMSVARVLQFGIWMLLRVFKVVDVGRDRFYSGIFVKCKK